MSDNIVLFYLFFIVVGFFTAVWNDNWSGWRPCICTIIYVLVPRMVSIYDCGNIAIFCYV